ncbi:MAG: helix-turn-helix domain-containing protein [Solirubrobacteraceae bacterium]|nr:helix-turn-helix domain-containing protein [Solirubrobacteraceae bacterium]
MARWEPGAPDRLQEAAYELYTERGYDATTVAEIAERAGLTKRTFFRHFADKREVLFWRSERVTELVVEAVEGAPADVGPFEAASLGVVAATEFLNDRRPFSQRRHALISANPELQERELIKMARLSGSVAEALRARGVAEVEAAMAAEATMAAFRVGWERWVEPTETRSFTEVAREMLDGLRAVAAA